MATTIQVSDDIRNTLEKMKLYQNESYNEVIERMLEDHVELNEKTKKEIEAARKRVKQGKFVTMDTVTKKYGV
jgi:predicted transcriptional regulator